MLRSEWPKPRNADAIFSQVVGDRFCAPCFLLTLSITFATGGSLALPPEAPASTPSSLLTSTAMSGNLQNNKVAYLAQWRTADRLDVVMLEQEF